MAGRTGQTPLHRYVESRGSLRGVAKCALRMACAATNTKDAAARLTPPRAANGTNTKTTQFDANPAGSAGENRAATLAFE